MNTPAVVALHLVLLHTVDGRETLINPDHVNSVSSHKVGEPNKVLVDSVECVIALTNGKFVSVIEPCDVVRKLLEEAK
jgi:uncharacterized protein YlzI (FlbEa/FlbD family)